MAFLGVVFFVLGILMAGAGYGIDPSVSAGGLGLDRIANNHLLSIKTQLVTGGAGACIVGAVLYGLAQVRDRLDTLLARTPVPAGVMDVAGRGGAPSSGRIAAGGHLVPDGYTGMFKGGGGVEIWTNKEGRAWAAGNYFDTVDEAQSWARSASRARTA